MSSFWRNFNHWLHWKLSFWQLPVQPVMKISSKRRHFRFSASRCWSRMSDYNPYVMWTYLLMHALNAKLVNILRPKQNGHHFTDDIFKRIFVEWKLSYFGSNFTEICSQGSNYQYTSIGSDDGLAPNRRPAFAWVIGDLVYWRIYASLSLSELMSVNERDPHSFNICYIGPCRRYNS